MDWAGCICVFMLVNMWRLQRKMNLRGTIAWEESEGGKRREEMMCLYFNLKKVTIEGEIAFKGSNLTFQVQCRCCVQAGNFTGERGCWGPLLGPWSHQWWPQWRRPASKPRDVGVGGDGTRVGDFLWEMRCLQPHSRFHFLWRLHLVPHTLIFNSNLSVVIRVAAIVLLWFCFLCSSRPSGLRWPCRYC